MSVAQLNTKAPVQQETLNREIQADLSLSQRIGRFVIALLATLPLFIGLCFKPIRDYWVEAWTGKETIRLSVIAREPLPPIAVIEPAKKTNKLSKHVSPTLPSEEIPKKWSLKIPGFLSSQTALKTTKITLLLLIPLTIGKAINEGFQFDLLGALTSTARKIAQGDIEVSFKLIKLLARSSLVCTAISIYYLAQVWYNLHKLQAALPKLKALDFLINFNKALTETKIISIIEGLAPFIGKLRKNEMLEKVNTLKVKISNLIENYNNDNQEATINEAEKCFQQYSQLNNELQTELDKCISQLQQTR